MQNSAEHIVCCESHTSVRPGYLSFRSKDIYPGLIAVTLGHTGTPFCPGATTASRETDRRLKLFAIFTAVCARDFIYTRGTDGPRRAASR